jgi:folylpolyglutamate synthase/dihydropteroate synthase
LNAATKDAGPKDLVVVLGSIFIAAEALQTAQ